MANKLKVLVSKKRRRFINEMFDLDLTYITPRVIAMGFPAEKLEGVYRNHIDDVVKFLEHYHKGHYRVYNLCNERDYAADKFPGRVVKYPFADHNVPKFFKIEAFCIDVFQYLAEHEDNIAAVHCKAGKGRTGLMICCYLLFSEECPTPEKSLNLYSEQRTSNAKGVTIPSQQRYVHYYGHLLTHKLAYSEVPFFLTSIRFHGVPTFSTGGCTPQFVVHASGGQLMCSQVYDLQRQTQPVMVCQPCRVFGDVNILFYNKPRMMKKEKMFSCWLNTFFVINPTEGSDIEVGYKEEDSAPLDPDNSGTPTKSVHTCALTLAKGELDKANKDTSHKLFPADFKVTFLFQTSPSLNPPARAIRSAGDTLAAPVLPSSRPSLPNLQGSCEAGFEDMVSEVDSVEDNLSETDPEDFSWTPDSGNDRGGPSFMNPEGSDRQRRPTRSSQLKSPSNERPA